jgi:tRNA(Arg) A34 adenosine deaminase TadA
MSLQKPNDSSQNNKIQHCHITRSIYLKTHPDNLILQERKLTESQYYATGAVAYLSSEPCIMCAMALLHNRISLAIFPSGTENKIYGGLGGCISLHTNGQLNHRFHVLVVNLN